MSPERIIGWLSLGPTSIFSVVYRSESFTEKRKTNDICTYNCDFLMKTTLDVTIPFPCKMRFMLKMGDEAASFSDDNLMKTGLGG